MTEPGAAASSGACRYSPPLWSCLLAALAGCDSPPPESSQTQTSPAKPSCPAYLEYAAKVAEAQFMTALIGYVRAVDVSVDDNCAITISSFAFEANLKTALTQEEQQLGEILLKKLNNQVVEKTGIY